MRTKNKTSVLLMIFFLSISFNLCAWDIEANRLFGKSIRFKSSMKGERFLTVQGGRSQRKTEFAASIDNYGFAQTFQIEDAGNGYVYIKAESGRYLHVWHANPNQKAIVSLWDKVNQDNLKWKIKKDLDGKFYIISKLGNYLSVKSGSLSNGAGIWMWSFNGKSEQKWEIEIFKEFNFASFRLEKHGFKFSNSFKNGIFRNGPDVFEFGGLCGGMVYSALDYFYSSIDIPETSIITTKKSPLESYIYERQQNSFWPNTDRWVELTFNPLGERDREFYYWGLEGRLATLKKRIDRNQPVPLGLYTTGNGFSGHHQVLAIGYDLGGYRFLKEKDRNQWDVKIFIYDPNHPDQVMILKPGNNNTWSYWHSKKVGMRYTATTQKKSWRTYFIDHRYRKRKPIDFSK